MKRLGSKLKGLCEGKGKKKGGGELAFWAINRSIAAVA